MSDDIPPPGSEEAREKGCECPVMDNQYGRGAYKGRETHGDGWNDAEYIINMECPLHKDD